MAVFDGGTESYTRSSNLMNYLGAAASVALMAGIGVWSYDLIKRDVSGIPVVRAVEGDMRVLPDNPGGEVALHTGLSVNAVPAEGEAAELGDMVVLAPATTDLPQEDLDLNPSAEAGEVLPADIAQETAVPVVADPTDPTEVAVAEALTAEDVLRLADEIAAGAERIEVSDADVVPPVLAVDGAPVIDVIPASVPGVSTSLRPVQRPGGSVVQAVAQAAVAPVTPAARPATPAVTPASIPAGTHLVQLGAFPTSSDAEAAWTALQEAFGDFLVSKERVIQAADSGGSTFYRLRAMGFDDLSDARRFCAALEAGDADCIPVVVR